ncbi:toprim domain-containing protein [Gramella lutea]|uniref:Toprim domain-containing protein n=1 Tax=Christiangramia lutea TaxID=1607951 RepID=A0A9X1V0J6_9FLAO|nr:DUF6371 domain-containing protein [Christiangramia lutea]MCH4821761.1 toprim domain-containing protein [Christiangramia lutea]
MSSNYRFILEPYTGPKSRYRCPSCHKPKVFTRYIDLGNSKKYIDDTVGRCDREQKCEYHLSPSEYFESTNTLIPTRSNSIPINKKVNKTSFIPDRYVKQSLRVTSENNFLDYLHSVINNEEAINKVREKYFVGTSKKWFGATIFWQIDDKNRTRTGKCILYNSETGRKQKINWVHAMAKLQNFNLQQCLFGLHLINTDNKKPIAIVESEKTAIIASLAFPEYIWMATGGLNNLKEKMLKPLRGRNVILFPDAGCYKIWKVKIETLPSDINIQISDLLYHKATPEQKREGLDIADYIIDIWKNL